MVSPEPDRRELGYYVTLAQAGIEMVVPLGIGVWLDQLLGWTPWATVIGTILGFVGGITHLVILGQRGQSQQPKKK